MTDSTSKKKVTASEMVGELRKMRRMYDVFKNAHAAAEILSSFEAEEPKVRRRMEELIETKKELASLNSSIEKAIEENKRKLSSVTQAIESFNEEHDGLVKAAEMQARARASEIIKAAESKATEAEERAAKAMKEKDSLTQDINKQKSALINLEDQIKRVKSRAIESLAQ